MRLIDPSFVGVSRALIASQGGNPLMVNDDGSLNPEGAISLFFNQVEMQTSITPPLRFPIGPSGPPADDALIRSLKPAIIFSGPAGRVVIAPYGAEPGTSWLPLIIGGVAVCGLGWLLFGDRR